MQSGLGLQGGIDGIRGAVDDHAVAVRLGEELHPGCGRRQVEGLAQGLDAGEDGKLGARELRIPDSESHGTGIIGELVIDAEVGESQLRQGELGTLVAHEADRRRPGTALALVERILGGRIAGNTQQRGFAREAQFEPVDEIEGWIGGQGDIIDPAVAVVAEFVVRRDDGVGRGTGRGVDVVVITLRRCLGAFIEIDPPPPGRIETFREADFEAGGRTPRRILIPFGHGLIAKIFGHENQLIIAIDDPAAPGMNVFTVGHLVGLKGHRLPTSALIFEGAPLGRIETGQGQQGPLDDDRYITALQGFALGRQRGGQGQQHHYNTSSFHQISPLIASIKLRISPSTRSETV